MKGRVNGKVVYMDEGQLPRFTLSLNEVVDLSKIRGTRSTTLRILNTPEARQALGSEAMAELLTASPELVLDDGGVDLFRSKVIPVKYTRDAIECISVAGNASWFEYAKATKLRTFDFGESPVLSAQYIMDSWTDADRLLYFPVIDFGSFNGQPDTHLVRLEKLRPSFRVHALINAALAPTGYTMQARGALARDWKKYVVVSDTSRTKRAHWHGNPAGAVVQPTTGFGMTFTELGTTSNRYLLSVFGSPIEDPSSSFASSALTMNDAGFMDVRVSALDFGFDPFSPPTGQRFHLHVYDFTTNTVLDTISRVFDPGVDIDGNMAFHHTFRNVPCIAGNEIGLGFQVDVGDPIPAMESAGGGLVTFSPVDPYFTPTFYPYEYQLGAAISVTDGLPIIINTAAPEMSLSQLITGLATNRGLVFTTDDVSKVIGVWDHAEYFRTPGNPEDVRDWSTRMDHTVAPIKARVEQPARILFRWKEDSNDEQVKDRNIVQPDPGYGNADVEVGGYGKEVINTLPFAATAMGLVFDNFAAPIMRKYLASIGEDAYEIQPRLLIADGVQAGTWNLQSQSLTEAPRCYFALPSETPADNVPLAFSTVFLGSEGIEQNTTPGTVERFMHRSIDIMRTNMALDAAMFIDDRELTDFDHGQPTLVDDGTSRGWYYVQQITQHQFMRPSPTRCILVPCGYGVQPDAAVNPAPTYVVPDDNPVEPPFEEPLWRTPLVTVRFGFNSLDMEDFEAVCIALPLVYPPDTFDVIVNDHLNAGDADGSTYIRRHTGCVLRWMGAGNGDAGSGWADQNVPVGSIVEVTNDNGPDRIRMVVQQVGSTLYSASGGSGKFSVRYCASIAPLPAPSPSSTTALDVASLYTGVNSNRLSFMDYPRRCKIQYNTVESDTGSLFWMDAAMPLISEANAYAGFTVNIPNDALFMRAVWYRVDYEQGTGGITNAFD